MLEGISIVGLLALNGFQLWYWSRVASRLVDKIMSRNYAEYVQVSKTTELPPKIVLPPEEDQEEEILGELNGMFRQ